MRINLVCIYWSLLSVSFVSSCLLFILVASENEKLSSAPASSVRIEDDKISINSSAEGRQQEVLGALDDPEPRADIRSSFNEVLQEPESPDPDPASFGFGEHLSQNSGVSDGFSDTSGVVFTLVDNVSAELHQRAELTLEPSHVDDKNASTTPTVATETADASNKTEVDPLVVTREESTLSLEDRSDYSVVNDTKELGEEQKLNVSEEVKDSKEVHDIPSFSEWTQKQLEEAEKKEKVNTSANSQNVVKNVNHLKLRSKNYASPDCGAKIIASNPEAVSAGSVLSPSRDEYKLNTCTSRIWFIVELCEAIQAKKIDLANFELFSSSPKDFSVSVSDRFPSRDWSSVGQFTAKDERDVQSFNLHPHLFGKYIKVEMFSHYGSEHFCPISLFRVYGTSEFEVLETEDQAPISEDDDDDDDLDSYNGEPSNNLFGSARDAVMSIVKKAAEVLAKGGDSNQTEKGPSLNVTYYAPLINTCNTPSHIVVCDNCSDLMFGSVYELLSCKQDHLKSLIGMKIINQSLYNTDICLEFGLNFTSKRTNTTTDSSSIYITMFFSPKYLAALCNILAVIENKVVLNVSSTYANSSSLNSTINEDLVNVDVKEVKTIEPTSCEMGSITEPKTCAGTTLDNSMDSSLDLSAPENLPQSLEIKPTKTISKEEKHIDPSLQELTQESIIEATGKALEPSENVNNPSVSPTGNQSEEVRTESFGATSSISTEESSENFELGNEQFDKLLSELSLDQDGAPTNAPTTVAPPSNVPQQAQKESVFLRLSSRIKALERNMSLSGQYLEELSRRYKKQVEEMQKAFEKKLVAINDELKRRDDRESKMQEQLTSMAATLSSLVSERDGFWKTASLIGQFLLVEVFIVGFFLYFCWRAPENVQTVTQTQSKTVVMKRRQSIDTIGHESPVIKKSRRPSEEALKISGTYEDLLISEDGNWPLTKAEKRRRRKHKALLRSHTIVVTKDNKEPMRRASSSDVNQRFMRQASAPTQMLCINGDLSPPVRIEEIPFALDESEHPLLEPLELYNNDAQITKVQTERGLQNSAPNKNGAVKSSTLKSHGPLFMRTALSSRSKRNSKLKLFTTEKVNGDDSSQKLSTDSSFNSNNGFSNVSASDSQDDQSSVNSLSLKKEKKSGGLRRMFRKVFE